jgi:hypothetical protein
MSSRSDANSIFTADLVVAIAMRATHVLDGCERDSGVVRAWEWGRAELERM